MRTLTLKINNLSKKLVIFKYDLVDTQSFLELHQDCSHVVPTIRVCVGRTWVDVFLEESFENFTTIGCF